MHSRDIEVETHLRDRAAQARAATRPRRRLPLRHRMRHAGRRLATLGERTAAGAMWLLLLALSIFIIAGTFIIVEGMHTMAGGDSVGQKIDRGIGRINAMFAGAGERVQDSAQAVRQRAENAGQALDDHVEAAGAAVHDRTEALHQGVSDAAIAASIKTDVLKDPYLSAGKVEVAVSGGVVTLSGTAGSDASRERAGRMASAIAGVKQVNNQLAVAPATAAR
ncbi:MAG TPA: BON domain-containing protein [Burkholderiales bacterium]|jgi:hypothetical protein